MKKVILMLAVAAMASCAKSELAERPTAAVVGDVEIVSGSKVAATRTPFEGTLNDKANNSLTAYVYATKLDVDNSNAYVDYTAANLAAHGYMTFVSDASMTAGKYPVAAVGFQKEDTAAPGTYVADPQYYPANDNPLYMVGLVPAQFDDVDTTTEQEGWKMDTDSLTASYAIDGKTDIMAAAVTTMNDGTSPIKKTVAKIDATVPANSKYPAFVFEHKLTLVNVKAYTPTQKEQALWGKITKIELIAVNGVTAGVDDLCTVTLKDAAAAVSGAATDKVTPFYYYGLNTDVTPVLEYSDLKISKQAEKDADTDGVLYGPVEIPAPATATAAAFESKDAEYVAYAMIAPFTTTHATATRPNLILKVYTEENENGIDAKILNLYNSAVTYDPSGSVTNTDEYLGLTEGKKFDVTLKFVGNEIKASATVTDWEEKFVPDVEVM